MIHDKDNFGRFIICDVGLLSKNELQFRPDFIALAVYWTNTYIFHFYVGFVTKTSNLSKVMGFFFSKTQYSYASFH